MSSKCSKVVDAYLYDDEGFFNGLTMYQMIDGEANPVPNSTLLCPWTDQPDPKYFYKFVDGAWTLVLKPTCAEDCINITVSHTSTTQHDIELRNLIRQFSREEGYREKRGEDLSWMIEKIPEKTEEEKLKEAKEQVRAKRDALIAETDYFVMEDYPSSTEDKNLVLAYRQLLRDVPQQEGFPYEVIWPEKPSCL